MKSKINIVFLIAGIAILFHSCGGETVSSKEKLLKKKSELKEELAEIEAKLSELDTISSQNFPLVKWDTLKSETFVHKLEIQGSVEADLDALINAEASGVLTSVNVKEGDKVRKGQLLATIDADILGKNIDEVEASLELADFVYEKQKNLYEEGVSSQLEFEQAKNNKLSLEQRLKTLKTQKGKTNVRAPFTGVVDEVFAKQGAMASPQTPLLRLVNNNTVKVSGGISERHLKTINEETPVEIELPALDTVIYHVITNKGIYIDPTNRTFRVQSLIKNNEFLLPNLAAVMRVTDIKKENAITVNENAILLDNMNRSFIYVLKQGEKVDEIQTYEVEKVLVDRKSSYNGKAWIEPKETINEGSLIVTEGAKGITAEDVVRLN